jgi:hypothetical protein
MGLSRRTVQNLASVPNLFQVALAALGKKNIIVSMIYVERAIGIEPTTFSLGS